MVPRAVVLSGFKITEVVSGMARGADTLGCMWARAAGIPIKKFPADWAKHGDAAGPIRNQEMADYANALIALWDGESRGTADMIVKASENGLKIYVWRVDDKDNGELGPSLK